MAGATLRGLVLGGAGMLGRDVVAAGRRRGYPVLGLSRAQADVTSPEALSHWVRSFRPQVVFNCAAHTRVDDCETERDAAFAINGEGAGQAAAAAAQVGARLVHVSTDYVFDGEASEPYREDAPTAPRSVYGASKLAGEEAVLGSDLGERGDALVVRTSWLFGPGGPNFAATMVRLLDRGMNPLRVVHDQVGAPTYTPFLAEALWDLAEAGASGTGISGIVHYQNREPVSWHGFAEAIARGWAPGVEVVPVTTEEFPRPAPRPAYSVLATDRFEAAVGRRPEPWIWGLSELLRSWRLDAPT